jgi:hypothetical protein
MRTVAERKYSHRHSNTLRQRETRMCRTFSGILLGIWIPFDKEKRGCLWHSRVFSSTFEYPSTKRNEDVYDILRYSHRHLNTLRQREMRMCMTFSGILINIRIPFDKEKRGCVWHSQVFSSAFEYPSIKRNEDVYDIRIPFDKEKRGCVWHSQVFSSTFEYPSTQRNEDVYDILRYSHRNSNTLRQRETRICMTLSGILINIRIPFDKEKRGCVWHSQVFLLTFECPSTKRSEDKLRCSQVFS